MVLDQFTFDSEKRLNSSRPTASELDGFAGIQNLQQLASNTTSDAHGDAVIELGHQDSIAIEGWTGRQLQSYLHSFVLLCIEIDLPISGNRAAALIAALGVGCSRAWSPPSAFAPLP